MNPAMNDWEVPPFEARQGPLGPAQFRGTLILSSKVFYSIQQNLKFL